ncbi:hypothetical protein GEMRC1_003280 [Eukaryota sp. GEM-RC1]
MYNFEPKLISKPFAEALEEVKKVITDTGFTIVSEIPVSDKIRNKLGVDYSNYTIIGFCQVKIAKALIDAEPHIGTMLPCNLVIRETETNVCEVAVVDLAKSLSVANNPDLAPILEEANALLAKLHSAL